MKALSFSVYCECVKNFLSEDRSRYLRSMREYHRMISPKEQTLRGHWALAAAAGFVTNSVPIIHLWQGRRRKFTTLLLGKMHTLCWAVGFKKTTDVQEPDDFQRVLLRWTQEANEDCRRDREVPLTSEVVERVSEKLRSAHL